MEITTLIQYDELLEKCKQGDHKSYSEIYQKYAKAMFNTSLRIVNNHSDAEDILQSAFTHAFTSLESFQYKSTFGAWLKRIIINHSINHLRKKKIAFIEIDQTTANELPAEEIADENHIHLKIEEIKQAITLLPNGYRTVLSLYLFEGYDHEEIAEILNISHVTVRTQYTRAKQKLINLMKQGGVS